MRRKQKRRNPDEYLEWQEYLSDITDAYPSEDYGRTAQELDEGGISKEDINDFSELREGQSSLYQGIDVAWDGVAGRMVKVPKEYAHSISGNIFYDEKLLRVMELVQRAADEGKIVRFDAPLVSPTLVDLGDVAESQQYWDHDPERGRPLSTGDEELDSFLKDPEDFSYLFEGYGSIFGSPVFEKMNESMTDKWELLHKIYLRWEDWRDDEIEVPEIEEAFYEAYEDDLSNYESIGAALEMARTTGTGDIGQLYFQVRDGNHRTFGSLAAGEPYFWGMMDKNSFEPIRNAIVDDKGNFLGFGGHMKGREPTPYQKALIEALWYFMDRWKGVKLKN